MQKDATTWARQCIRCQTSNLGHHTETEIGEFLLSGRRFGHIHVDVVGPLPPSGGARSLLTIVNHSTRWPEAMPTQEATTSACAEALLSSWISWLGVPDHITTNRGPAFLSKLWSTLAHLLGTSHHTTTAYNPAANGLDCPQASGDPSAAEKVYGEPLVVPSEIVTGDRHNPSVQKLRYIVKKFTPGQQTYTDRSVTFMPPGLSSTTHIFIRNDTIRPTLTRPYKGPFRVLEQNTKAFRLALHRKDDWVSVDRLKPALLEDAADDITQCPLQESSPPQPSHPKRKLCVRPWKHQASRSRSHCTPQLTLRSRGTLQRPSRYLV
ncbi:uncharacterized protein [Macrobrachium rosenbergii]|uniref:uncharacterized protein n=1 Tax=Macrobrachium rosenbergii TaxID=79674 RepID=UPI0034D73D47